MPVSVTLSDTQISALRETLVNVGFPVDQAFIPRNTSKGRVEVFGWDEHDGKVELRYRLNNNPDYKFSVILSGQRVECFQATPTSSIADGFPPSVRSVRFDDNALSRRAMLTWIYGILPSERLPEDALPEAPAAVAHSEAKQAVEQDFVLPRVEDLLGETADTEENARSAGRPSLPLVNNN